MIIKILAKIIFLLKVYIVMLSFGVFFIIIMLYFNKDLKFYNELFFNKVKNNEPYYPNEFISDIPKNLKWLEKTLEKPLNIALFFTILFSLSLLKAILFFISILYAPISIAKLINSFIKKKEFKVVVVWKRNCSSVELIKNIFINIPAAINYKIKYKILKKIVKKEKNSINLSVLAYKIVFNNFLGIPFWVIYNSNNILYRINRLQKIDLKKKKIHKIWILKKLLINELNESLFEHEKCYLNEVGRLRIYYVNNKMQFNPKTSVVKNVKITKNTLGSSINTIEEAIFKSPEKKEREMVESKKTEIAKNIPNKKEITYKNHFAIIKDGTGARFKVICPRTHEPLKYPIALYEKLPNIYPKYMQRSILTGLTLSKNALNESYYRQQHLIYNTAISNELIKVNYSGKEKFSDIRMETEINRVEGRRFTDEGAGLVYQTPTVLKGLYDSNGYFHENLVEFSKINNDKKLEEYAKRMIEEYKEGDIHSSEFENTAIRLSELDYNNFNGHGFEYIDKIDEHEKEIKKTFKNIESYNEKNMLDQECSPEDSEKIINSYRKALDKEEEDDLES